MTMEESYGHGWNKPFHPDDKQRAWDAWERATQYNERYSLECRLRRADGVYRWWLVRGEPMRGANGEILKWFGTCTDIEELKRAEILLHEANALLEQRVAERTAALRESEERLRFALETSHIGAWDLDLVHNTAFRSLEHDRVFGYPELLSEWTYEMFLDHVLPEERETVDGKFRRAIECRSEWNFECRIRRVDGEVRWIWAAGQLSRDASETLLRMSGVVQDITERKQAEDALSRAHDRLVLAQQSAGAGIWDWDIQSDKLDWSPELFRLFGLNPAGTEASFATWNSVVHPEDLQPAADHIDSAIRNRKRLMNEYRIILPEGETRWINALGDVVYNPNGKALRMSGICLDITARKQAEELIKASLHEKEVLLKEIHHRVKNNMQVISSLVSLQADGSKDEAVREVLKDVTYRVRSMALVHEKLYQSADLARIDFAEYTRSLLGYLWRAHGAAAADVRLTLDLELVQLPVDTAVPCGLILNELAGNSLKHAFRGRSEGEVTVALQNDGDGRIRLSVHDNGAGLPDGLDWRQAPSLGLRLVQMLSKQLGASVEVSGGDGTMFEIVFQADRTRSEG
jgi:PAS domain S-box-containing protein